MSAGKKTNAKLTESEALGLVREHVKKGQAALAASLGVSQSTVARWLRGNEPNAKLLKLLKAKMPGMFEEKPADSYTLKDDAFFYQGRLRRLMAEHKLDRRGLAEAAGVRVEMVGRWLRGKLPAAENRESLCRALKTSPQELFFGDVETTEL